MNILISLPYFPLPNSGTGNAVYGLAKGLKSAGSIVEVLAEGDVAKKSVFKGVDYVVFRKRLIIHKFLPSKILIDYIKNTSENNKTLVILNGTYVPYMYMLGKFLYEVKIPFVFIPHTVYNETSFVKSYYKKKIYFKFFEKKLIERATAVQMFSETQLFQLKRLVSLKNTICLPNGIDTNLLDYNVDENKRNDLVKIIFLGRKEVFMKGLDLLIKAFAKCSDESMQLYIQGKDIGETDLLEGIITELKLKNVFLLDNFNGNVVSYLTQFDILILPSRHEAFAMTVVEAMLAKLPILVSDQAGSAPHVLEAKSGMVFSPTIEGIYGAINSMMVEKSQWNLMGDNGFEYVTKNLNWDKIGELALKSYNKLITK